MNPQPPSAGGSRRDFLRNTALGGLAALTAALVSRSPGRTCVNEGICRGCTAYEDCILPQALSAKQVLGNLPLR